MSHDDMSRNKWVDHRRGFTQIDISVSFSIGLYLTFENNLDKNRDFEVYAIQKFSVSLPSEKMELFEFSSCNEVIQVLVLSTTKITMTNQSGRNKQ